MKHRYEMADSVYYFLPGVIERQLEVTQTQK